MTGTSRPERRLLLVDTDPQVTAAWHHAFGTSPRVTIHDGSFKDVLPIVDALITAGNSYGWMTGGIDLAVANTFPDIQSTVTEVINRTTAGYLPVGAALLAPTGQSPCRYLVYAPTMRIPRPLPTEEHVAIHDALWASLVALDHHDPTGDIETIACPGLGTGYGEVPPASAAHFMATAWSLYCNPTIPGIRDRERQFRNRNA